MGIEISGYLKEQAKKTLEIMIEQGTSKEFLPDDASFFITLKKENGCIARINYKGKKYYLCQVF